MTRMTAALCSASRGVRSDGLSSFHTHACALEQCDVVKVEAGFAAGCLLALVRTRSQDFEAG